VVRAYDRSVLAQVLDVLLAEPSRRAEERDDPPLGAWTLYVDKYAYVDGPERAEVRFNVPEPAYVAEAKKACGVAWTRSSTLSQNGYGTRSAFSSKISR